MMKQMVRRFGWLLAGALVLMPVGASCARRESALATPVALVQLIANPSDHYGERVVVVGYLSTDFEAVGLYLTEAEYRLKIPTNIVRLGIDERTLGPELANGGYALVEGTFSPKSGPNDSSCGRLTGITRLEPWPPWPVSAIPPSPSTAPGDADREGP